MKLFKKKYLWTLLFIKVIRLVFKMEKNKQDYGLGKIDGLLLVASAIGIAVSSFLLVNENILLKRFTTISSDHAEIGEVQRTKNDVRRKVGASLLWFKVDEDETLFEGDSVFTGEKSSTKFLLNSGVELTLQSNSLVILTTKEDEVFLDLQVGQFSAKTVAVVAKKTTRKNKKRRKIKLKSTINILQKGKVAQINLEKKAVLKVVKSALGALSLASKRGAVKVRLDGKVEDFKENEVIEIKKDLKLEKKKIKISLQKPSDDESLWLATNNKVQFKWKSNDGNLKYRLLVSRDRDFKNVIIDKETEFNGYVHKNLDSDQIYFWKISSSSNNGDVQESFVYRFETHNRSPLATFSPLHNYEINLDDGEKRAKINFYWENRSNDMNYQIQISKSMDFEKNEIDKKINKAEYTNLKLKMGQYF